MSIARPKAVPLPISYPLLQLSMCVLHVYACVWCMCNMCVMCVVCVHIWDMCTCVGVCIHIYIYMVYKFVYVYLSLRRGTLHSWLYGRDQQWIPVPKRNTKKKVQISGPGVGKSLSDAKLGADGHHSLHINGSTRRKQLPRGDKGWLVSGRYTQQHRRPPIPFLDVSSVLPKVSP